MKSSFLWACQRADLQDLQRVRCFWYLTECSGLMGDRLQLQRFHGTHTHTLFCPSSRCRPPLALTCWGGRGKERKQASSTDLSISVRVGLQFCPQVCMEVREPLKAPSRFSYLSCEGGGGVGSRNLCPGNVTKTCNEQTLDDIILRFGWN